MSEVLLAPKLTERLIEPSRPFAPAGEVRLGEQNRAKAEDWGMLASHRSTVPISHIRVRDAVLDPPTGLVFSNGEIVERLRYNLYPGEEEAARKRISGNFMRISDRPCFLGFNRFCAGNYGHWLTQAVPAISLYQREPDFSKGILLLPNPMIPEQHRLLALANIALPKIGFVATAQPLAIAELVVSTLLINQSRPYPAALSVYDEIAASAGQPEKSRRLIYVWRVDSSARQMRNEDVLVKRLLARGIEPVICGAMSLEEQIRAFQAADLIVGAHGAGLTNIAFCRPGTILYELFPHHYISYVPALYAQMRGMHYWADAHLAEAREDIWRHQTAWSVDLDAVEQRLDEIHDRYLHQNQLASCSRSGS